MGIYVSQMFDDAQMKRLTDSGKTGTETIDFGRSDYLDRPDHAAVYKKKMAALGIRDVIVHGPFFDLNAVSYDQKIAEASRERIEQAAAAAEFIGAKKMVFHSGYIPFMVFREGWTERMREFWKGFISRHPGLSVRIENVVDPDPGMLREFAAAADDPRIRICLDIGHANCASKVPLSVWAETLGGLVGEMHLHDNHGGTDEHLGLGKGNIGWQEVLLKVLSENPACDLTVECLDPEDAGMSVEKIREVTGK